MAQAARDERGGLPVRRGARLAPYDHRRVAPLDLAEQARDYEALLTFVKTSSVVSGVHLCAWDPNPSAGGTRDRGYKPQGKPAQAVMQRLLALTR